jgi:hypothetical protein
MIQKPTLATQTDEKYWFVFVIFVKEDTDNMGDLLPIPTAATPMLIRSTAAMTTGLRKITPTSNLISGQLIASHV